MKKKKIIGLSAIGLLSFSSVIAPLLSEARIAHADTVIEKPHYPGNDNTTNQQPTTPTNKETNEEHFKVVAPKYYSNPSYSSSAILYSNADLTTKKGNLRTEANNTIRSVGGDCVYKTSDSGNSKSLKLTILRKGTTTFKTIGYIDKNLFKGQTPLRNDLQQDNNVKVKDKNGNTVTNTGWKQKTVVTVMKKNMPVYSGYWLTLTDVDGTTNDFYHKTYEVRHHYQSTIDPSEKYSSLYRGPHEQPLIPDSALSDISNTKMKGAYYGIDKTMTLKAPYYSTFSELGDMVNGGNQSFTKKLQNLGDYKGKSLYINGAYTHVKLKNNADENFNKDNNGMDIYYSVSDKKDGKWLGYVSKDAFEDGMGIAGQYSDTTYVSIADSDYPIWTDENFNSKSGIAKKGDWYRAGYRYLHSNGSTYVELIRVLNDGKGEIAGFINKNALNFEDNNFGPYHSWDKTVKVKQQKNVYGLYKDKNFKNKVNSSDKLVGKSFIAKGFYDRLKSPDGENGGRYYSLYDSQGNWYGYMKSTAFEDVTKFGDYHSFDRYVTVTESDYNVFGDSNLSSIYGKTGTYIPLNTTYHAKGYYNATNGAKYYTVYKYNENGDEKWVGYINANAFTLGADDGHSKGGAWIDIPNKTVTAKHDWTLWGDFDYKEKRGTLTKNKQYVAKGEYHHFNGEKYYSLYDKSTDKWVGYSNIEAF